MAKGTLTFKGLEAWMEQLAEAGENVDNSVTELLGETQQFIEDELTRNLKNTTEQWTPNLGETIKVSGVQQEGNFLFVEAEAGQGDEEAAHAKEFGNSRQAAEPFFRPTFRGHRLKNKLKEGMKAIMQRFGLSKS